ncbi:MAG: Trk system potassium transporter TrkA [Nitrospinae bacterium CG11_big_fil_rev_8_21_14_0_20_56_8]|nr:MAG: Trk system potassium transporter TrkA [Nitrospinae bacterium CG11_big_fil_rev_8_21_14_0_20_56_8]
MRILIVGAGVVGNNLAQELSKEGHDIAIVDEDASKTRRITETLDVMAINGNACLPSVLLRAGIQKMEMVIAVTDKDEINILVCILAAKFNVGKRFARLRTMEFTGNGQVLKASDVYIDQAINPGQIIIDTIVKILGTPGAVSVAEFAEGDVLLREFDVPDNAPLAGKKIGDLSGISELDAISFLAIVREGVVILPKPEDEIRPGDSIYTLLDKEFLPFLLPMLNKKVDEVQKIVLFGANQISINLAKRLENKIRDLSIIEPSRERATEAAEVLSRTVVHNGSGTDMDLFNDINMSDVDFFMSLSDDDENNILAALLAKKHGAKKGLVITNDPEYLPILDSIGMDITINPRLITVSSILKHLRKGRVISVFRMIEQAEVMEVVVESGSHIAQKPFSKLKFPDDAKLGAVIRKGEMLIPSTDPVFEEGDSVIIIALPKAIEKIEKLFGRKKILLSF